MSVKAIRETIARDWGTETEALSRRRGGEDKLAAIYLCRKLAGLPVRQIAEEFAVMGLLGWDSWGRGLLGSVVYPCISAIR